MKRAVLVLLAAALMMGAGPFERTPTYFQEGTGGTPLTELTDADKVALTPELQGLRDSIGVVRADLETPEPLYIPADLAALEGSYEAQVETILPGVAVDELIEGDGWTTYRSVLGDVASSMGVAVDLDSDTGVQGLLDDFEALSEEQNIRLGEWGPGTVQGRIKMKIAKGKTFKAAKVTVLMEDGYTAEEASDKAEIDLLRDQGLKKADAVRQYYQTIVAGDSPVTRTDRDLAREKAEKRISSVKKKGGL